MPTPIFRLAALLLAIVVHSPRVQSAEPPQAPDGFAVLFNGSDFTGWHGLRPIDISKLAQMPDEERTKLLAADMDDLKKHWKVDNGELVNDGAGVYITTDKEYSDMEFLIEYKLLPKGDSGIYLRATPQVQVWDFNEEADYWKHGAEKGSGSLWNTAAAVPQECACVAEIRT